MKLDFKDQEKHKLRFEKSPHLYVKQCSEKKKKKEHLGQCPLIEAFFCASMCYRFFFIIAIVFPFV